MIDRKLKQTALQKLANTAGELAENYLRKEAEKIAYFFESETQYDAILDQIKLLETISFRVHNKAIIIFSALLERLKTIEFTYQEISGYFMEELREFQSKESLIISVLKALQRIRYYASSEILDLFFEYSIHSNEEIRKQAIAGIESLARYDLDIFYGDGKNWQGLGWGPQEKVLAKIETFSPAQKKEFLPSILAACKEMLSPIAEGTQWSSSQVVIMKEIIPAFDGIKELRSQILTLLKTLYAATASLEEKEGVIATIKTATTTPHIGKYDDDVLKMIIENTVTFLHFMKNIASSEDFQIMQKIEHDAYWFYYHWKGLDSRIAKITVEIRDMLMSNPEYQKFRILIGFGSIFHDWEKSKVQDDYEHEKEFREIEGLRLARSINVNNYDEWKRRILNYASIKSNDMATFPYFGKFLENFGKESPVLAIKLLAEVADQLGNFLIVVLLGIAASSLKPKIYELIENWVSKGEHLFSLARFFEFFGELDAPLFKIIFVKAKESGDLVTLSQIIETVTAQFKPEKASLIEEFFIPAIQILTEQKDTRWIFGSWFKPQLASLIATMNMNALQAILDNCFWVDKLDSQSEKILSEIAEIAPKLVIEFFGKRLAKEQEDGISDKFEAIPFAFYALRKSLSKIPSEAVDILHSQYNNNYGMFVHRGAKLLKNIFPSFPEEFAAKLMKVAQNGDESNLLFVMAILYQYEGQMALHPVCKELVSILPVDGSLLSEIRDILHRTGVVCGTHGFAEAYKRKIEEIKPWLEENDEKVKKFASDYIASLEKQIEVENKLADEELILRRHQDRENI